MDPYRGDSRPARARTDFRVAAVLTVRNEERFIGPCIENLVRQGVHVYVCDNESTDRTVEIAESYRDAGLIGIERVPHYGTYDWERLLRRKEELFQSLDADWLIHVDADELLLSPTDTPLSLAISAVDERGFDSVEFNEFTFVPTLEDPDHDSPEFETTLRTYYAFRPRSPHCVRAFKKQDGPMEIAWSGGHHVRFAQQIRLYPTPFRMKHYLFLSAEHAERKYVARPYREDLRARGWHGWRPALRPDNIRLPTASILRVTAADADLDASEPWTRHWLDQCVGS